MVYISFNPTFTLCRNFPLQVVNEITNCVSILDRVNYKESSDEYASYEHQFKDTHWDSLLNHISYTANDILTENYGLSSIDDSLPDGPKNHEHYNPYRTNNGGNTYKEQSDNLYDEQIKPLKQYELNNVRNMYQKERSNYWYGSNNGIVGKSTTFEKITNNQHNENSIEDTYEEKESYVIKDAVKNTIDTYENNFIGTVEDSDNQNQVESSDQPQIVLNGIKDTIEIHDNNFINTVEDPDNQKQAEGSDQQQINFIDITGSVDPNSNNLDTVVDSDNQNQAEGSDLSQIAFIDIKGPSNTEESDNLDTVEDSDNQKQAEGSHLPQIAFLDITDPSNTDESSILAEDSRDGKSYVSVKHSQR